MREQDYRKIQRTADKELTALERALIREYSQALKAIRAELAQAYGQYATQTSLELLKYNRLQNLEKSIRAILAELHYKNAKTLIDALQNQYQTMYYMTAWGIENSVGASLAWGVLNPDLVRQAVLAPIDKLTLNQRLERNRAKVLAAIRHELTQGLIKGEPYEKMAKRIKNVLEQDARKALLVARTEGHRIQNAAQLDSARRASDIGVKMVKVWDAALDMRTRPAHRRLDGTKVGVNENFRSITGGYGPAPGHMMNPADDCNCRCSFRLEIVGYEPTVRRIRGEGIKPYQTYEEWAKAKGIAS